jgi:hypothetical protein
VVELGWAQPVLDFSHVGGPSPGDI